MRRGLIELGALIVISSAPARADITCDVTIPVTMVDTMNSAHSYPGERFRFKTTAPAAFGDVDIPDGTEGYGVVRYVQGAKNHNRTGLLVLEPRFLVIGETRLAVMSDPRETAEFAHAVTWTERGLGMLPIGMAGTIINEIRMGGNVRLGPGFKFHVVVMGDIVTREPCKPKRDLEERRQSSPSPSPSPSSPPENS